MPESAPIFEAKSSVLADLLAANESDAGEAVSVDKAVSVAAVMACARVIAEGLAQIPCKLYRPTAAGRYGLVGGYDDLSGPKIAFDAGDLVSQYEWQPSPPTRERFNIARGRFANPSKLFQLEDWGAVETNPLPDGIPRTAQLDFSAVSRPETCQRIAKQFLLRDAYPGTFTAAFNAKAFAVVVGSLITLSLPSEGWSNKLFRVVEQSETHDLIFAMTLKEEAPEIYAWDAEEKPLPPDIRPAGFDPADTITPAGLTATARTVTGSNGAALAYIDIGWTPHAGGRVAGIEIQTKESTGSKWTVAAELFDASVGSFTVAANAPGITVDVQARYRMTTGVYSPFVTASVATDATPIDFAHLIGTTKPDANATRNRVHRGSSAPSSAVDGDHWYDLVGNHYTRLSGAWTLVSTIGADYDSTLTNRPAFFLDGRIPAGLNSDGTIANSKVLAASIAAGVINDTKFETGFEPVRRGSSLPSASGYTGPQFFANTSDGKLYRYHAGAWSAAVPAVDISGTLSDSQLAAISAAKVTGTLTDAQLSAISAAKVVTHV